MADMVAWPLGKLAVKTLTAGVTTSGLGRAKQNFSKLFKATPLDTAPSISHAADRLRVRSKEPTTASNRIPSTMVLPSAEMSRAASGSHGGPIGTPGLPA